MYMSTRGIAGGRVAALCIALVVCTVAGASIQHPDSTTPAKTVAQALTEALARQHSGHVPKSYQSRAAGAAAGSTTPPPPLPPATRQWTYNDSSMAESCVYNDGTGLLVLGYNFIEDPGVRTLHPSTGELVWKSPAGGYWGYSVSSGGEGSSVVAALGCQFLKTNCSLLVWDDASSAEESWTQVYPKAYTDFEPFHYAITAVPPSGKFVAAMWYTVLSNSNNARPCKACVYPTTANAASAPNPIACVSTNVSYPRVGVSNDGSRMLTLNAPGKTFVTTISSVPGGKTLFSSDAFVFFPSDLEHLVQVGADGQAVRLLQWDASSSTYTAAWTYAGAAGCKVLDVKFTSDLVLVACVDGEVAGATDATSRRDAGTTASVQLAIFRRGASSGTPLQTFAVDTGFFAIMQVSASAAIDGSAVAVSLQGAKTGVRTVFSSVYAAAVTATTNTGVSGTPTAMEPVWSDGTGCTQQTPLTFVPRPTVDGAVSGPADAIVIFNTPDAAQPGFCKGSTVASYRL